MSKYLISTGFAIAVVALAVSAVVASDDDKGGPNHFRANLSGYQETPSTLSTAGRGTFEAKIDDKEMTILRIRFSHPGRPTASFGAEIRTREFP